MTAAGQIRKARSQMTRPANAAELGKAVEEITGPPRELQA
jgi:hypothetical protein